MAERREIVIGLVGAVIGVAGGVLGSYLNVHLADRAEHPGSVTIGSPRDSATVSRLVEISGEVELPATKEVQLWIVIRVDVNNLGRYYPQGYVVPEKSGEWSCVVALGGAGKRKAQDGSYRVLAVFAEPRAALSLSDYVRQDLGRVSGGMADYPAEGLDLKDSIQLTRDSATPAPEGLTEQRGTC